MIPPLMLTADRVDRLVLLEWQEDEPAPVLDALMPLGLPPAAVLVVRRVAVVAAPSSVAGAVVAEVADASRQAARPLEGAVDPRAEAVLFADEAELLACYLVAIRARRLGDWFWSQLAGVLPPPVVDAVVGDPAVPLAGVVAALDGWRRADDVLAALGPSTRLVLLQALAEQHDLWVRSVAAPAPALPVDDSRAGVPATVPGEVAGDWSPAAYDLGRRGGAIPLAHVSTGPAFASSVVALVASLLGRSAPAAASLLPGPSSATDIATDIAGGAGAATAADVEPPPVGLRRVGEPAATRDRDRAVRSGPPEQAVDPVAHVPAAQRDHDDTASSLEDTAEGVATELAGVFYLVNAYRRLDLRAFDLADAAPWDVVDGLARSVVPVDRHDDDPVWLELQALAGRSPGEPPAPAVLARCATAMVQVLDDLALEPDEPALAELLAVPGRLVVDRTHVEVLLALDAVDLAVRRRALDADPGWVPSLGRVIRFHFVDGRPVGAG